MNGRNPRQEMMKTPAERLMSRLVVVQRDYETPCEEFGSSKSYGKFMVGGVRGVSTHRWRWEDAYGPIPSGLCVCHHCDNPPCCRLDHLFLGTTAENAADMVAKGRWGGSWGGPPMPAVALREAAKTHCRQGHPFDEANTRFYNGSRYCRECNKADRRRRYYAKLIDSRIPTPTTTTIAQSKPDITLVHI